MEQLTLYVMLSAAATALIVAAALGWLTRRHVGAGWPAPVALVAGLAVATRLALGHWPPLPPTQAIDCWPLVVLAAVVAIGVGSLILKPAAPAWAGLVVGLMIVLFPLALTIGRVEPVSIRRLWMIGIVATTMVVPRVVARAFTHAVLNLKPDASFLARLRDEHWPTLGLGVVFALSAPAILFTATSMKFLMLMLAVGLSLAGLAVAGLFQRVRLAAAAAVAVVASSTLWFMAYFTGNDFSILALALALLAPVALIIGTTGPLARRGGWMRVVVVCVVAAVPLAAVHAMYGPAYLRSVNESDPSGSGE